MATEISFIEMFKERLCGKGHPVLGWLSSSLELTDLLSGPNLWMQALHERRRLKGLIQAGDRVLLSVHDRQFVVRLLAVWMLECVAVPSVMEESLKVFPSTEEERAKVRARSLRLQLFSSGTSGPAKSVFFNASQIHYQLSKHETAALCEVGEDRLCLLPWTHAFGFVLDLLLGLWTGSTLHIPMPASKPSRCISYMHKQGGSFRVNMVPRQLALFLAQEPAASLPIRVLHLGGALTPPEVLQTLPFQVFNGYGLTEAGPGVLLNGKPLDGTRLEIRDQVLWVSSPSWGIQDLDEEGLEWHPTADLFKINDNKYEFSARLGTRVKGAHGLWLDVGRLEKEMEQRFRLEAPRIEVHQSPCVLATKGECSQPALEWLEKRLGQKCLLISHAPSFQKAWGAE